MGGPGGDGRGAQGMERGMRLPPGVEVPEGFFDMTEDEKREYMEDNFGDMIEPK